MRILLFFWATIFLLPVNLIAWSEARCPDDVLAKRSEIAVVAHLKPASLVMSDLGGSYEGHAVLIITETLKGDSQAKEIPIFINYGLLPIPKKYERNLDAGPRISLYRYDGSEPILLFDDNPSEGDFKIIDDIRKDQIWLLRHGSTAHLGNRHNLVLGVWDPQDIQPLGRRSQLQRYFK